MSTRTEEKNQKNVAFFFWGLIPAAAARLALPVMAHCDIRHLQKFRGEVRDRAVGFCPWAPLSTLGREAGRRFGR